MTTLISPVTEQEIGEVPPTSLEETDEAIERAEGIEHADSEALVVQAKVIWCSARDDGGYTAGMQFGTLSANQSAAVESFLRRLHR